MDPNTCLRDIEIGMCHHVGQEERLDVYESVESLIGWINRGGFLPKKLTDAEFTPASSLFMLKMFKDILAMPPDVRKRLG